MRTYNILSYNFDKMGRSGIGLYELTSIAGFPGFGIISTSATFQNDCTVSSLNEALKIYVNFTIMLFGRRLRTSVIIKSNLGHFFNFGFKWICSKTSIDVASDIV